MPPPLEVTIRRAAGQADAGAAAALFLRARRAAVPAIPPPVHDDASVGAHFAGLAELWLAETVPDRRLAGILARDGDWILHLYVEPELTGRGVGTALLGVVLRPGEFARGPTSGGLYDLRSAGEIRPPSAPLVWTFQANTGARRFYERHGFVALRETDGRDNSERAPDVL